MSKLVPKYTLWEAVGTAISLGLRALEEIRNLARMPGPRGADGLGFDDMRIEQTGERSFSLRFARGRDDLVREWRITVPATIYRGGWTERPFERGDAVTFDGSMWVALDDTAEAPGGAGWQLAVKGGRDGSDGRSFRIRGTWLEINDYLALDVVALGGASFAAKRDDPGPCPGEGWQLIAAQGKRGEPGRRGLPGERGESGSAVVAMGVSDDGVLTLERSDGSLLAADLHPLLASR